MIISYLKKILNYINRKGYVNETIILYQLDKLIKQESEAIIKIATKKNITDTLYFQSKRIFNYFELFLSINDKGYLGYINNKCIHRSWVKSNEQTVNFHPLFSYRLKKNEIFIHFCETATEARGKNIYPHVLSEIITEHQNNRILIAVNSKNIPSIKGIEKVGFKQELKIHIVVIMGIKFIKKK